MRTRADSPERRVEHDDQVEVDEEGEVLPEQRLLHGATIPAHLALAGFAAAARRPRLLLGERRVVVIAPDRDPHRSTIHPTAHVPQKPLRGPYHDPATGQESVPYPESLHTPHVVTLACSVPATRRAWQALPAPSALERRLWTCATEGYINSARDSLG